jgi:hypothetical protein
MQAFVVCSAKPESTGKRKYKENKIKYRRATEK